RPHHPPARAAAGHGGHPVDAVPAVPGREPTAGEVLYAVRRAARAPAPGVWSGAARAGEVLLRVCAPGGGACVEAYATIPPCAGGLHAPTPGRAHHQLPRCT